MRLAQQQDEWPSQGPLTRLPITFRVGNLKTTPGHQKSISNPNHGNQVREWEIRHSQFSLGDLQRGKKKQKWVQWWKTHVMNLNFKTEKKVFGYGFYSLKKDSEEEWSPVGFSPFPATNLPPRFPFAFSWRGLQDVGKKGLISHLYRVKESYRTCASLKKKKKQKKAQSSWVRKSFWIAPILNQRP